MEENSRNYEHEDRLHLQLRGENLTQKRHSHASL